MRLAIDKNVSGVDLKNTSSESYVLLFNTVEEDVSLITISDSDWDALFVFVSIYSQDLRGKPKVNTRS